MRHLGSLVLSLLFAPMIWLAAGFTTVRVGNGNGLGADRLTTASLGILAALVAGVLIAILVMNRLSPLGPGLVGLAYLAVTVWPLVDQASFERTVPESFLGVGEVLRRPVVFGVLALLAAPMLMTLGSGRRWRRFAGPDPATHGTVYGSPTGMDYPTAWSGSDYQPTTPLYPPSTSPSSADNDPTRRL